MSFKKAFLKAGIVSKDQVIAAELQASRKKRIRPIREEPVSEKKHTHHFRSLCDSCGNGSPDVEYYEHNIRILNAHWLCVNCADLNNIHDKFRKTAQSQHSITKVFCRRYGPTLDIKDPKTKK